MEINKKRLLVLENIAKQNNILIRYIPSNNLSFNNQWQGFICRFGNLGTAIAILDELTLPQKVIVLAHELGHYFSGIGDYLFNPIEYGGKYNKHDLENEKLADAKGFELIYDKITFDSIEKRFPLHYQSLANALILPVDIIGMWDNFRLRKHPSAKSIYFPLNEYLTDEIFSRLKRGKASGGFQSMLRRILGSEKNNLYSISLKDYLKMRSSVNKDKGGYVTLYNKILDNALISINEVGGIEFFFNMKTT